MRHRHLIGLILLSLGAGLGATATVMVYAYGEQQEALLVRMGIPGAVLLALAIGALIVWGRVLETGPDSLPPAKAPDNASRGPDSP